jgi:hypothetical protein
MSRKKITGRDEYLSNAKRSILVDLSVKPIKSLRMVIKSGY